jgi:tight adherence protein C
MFPPWALAAFYVVAGATVLWLLLRIWQKRQVSRLSERPAPVLPRSERAVQPAPAPTPPPVAATPPLPPELSILKQSATPAVADLSALPAVASNVSVASAAADDAPRPSVLASASAEPSAGWHRERLFGDIPVTSASLARVLAEEVPATRSDDLIFGSVTPLLASMLPDSDARREETRTELISAGYYQPHAMQNLAAIRYLTMMAGLIVAFMLLLSAPARVEWIAIGSLVMLPLLGWALPRLYVRGVAVDRRSEIERGMPDLLDMLNMCVSQGLTIPESMRRILRDLRGPYPALAQELRIISEQGSIGNMHLALDNFSRRLDIPEVHSFTSLLIQTEKMGTSISEALASYSDTMRESLRQRADEKGNRATFQLLFPTVLCLMPAVYLFLLGPAIIDLSNFFSAGGRESLDQGSQVIQRINADRRATATRPAAP